MNKEELKIIKSMEERITKLEKVVTKSTGVMNQLIKQGEAQRREIRRLQENGRQLQSKLEKMSRRER